MRVVVPFDSQEPKTRLSSVLAPAERQRFARAMLQDVLEAISATDITPTVLATGPMELDVPVIVDERPLTPAVNGVLADGTPPLAVVMADLPLATSKSIERLLGTEGDLVLVPGRGGGTNAVLTRTSSFRVDYHGMSYADHLTAARKQGAEIGSVDSYRLSTDIDEPTDLPEVLLHGSGAAADWLETAGFELSSHQGRVRVHRP